jgi:hypothetical protein
MKRFHLHICVKDLDGSVRFHSALFAEQPTVRKTDYAKWMLEDRCINFAISTDRQPPDPTGIAWETFHTLGSIPVYGEDTAVFDHGASTVLTDQADANKACCESKVSGEPCCVA